jgi:hypothetical protein
VDDFAHLRSDPGLAELIGHEMPSPEVARKFLHAFHEEEKIEEAQQRRLPDEIAYIPEENRALEGLGRNNRDLIHRLGERCVDQKIATVDQDATIIESRKREARCTPMRDRANGCAQRITHPRADGQTNESEWPVFAFLVQQPAQQPLLVTGRVVGDGQSASSGEGMEGVR